MRQVMKVVLFAVVMLSGIGGYAQQATADPTMMKFFVGNWGCAGEFASGKKIEADVSFAWELDGKWLLYRHEDRPPERFKATAMWGVDEASGKPISVMEDNFGNARLFTSEGWKDGAVTFSRTEFIGQKISPERFRYERQSDNGFKMTYERLVDAQWKMGDFIVCTRK
jgi:hypothetical protein